MQELKKKKKKKEQNGDSRLDYNFVGVTEPLCFYFLATKHYRCKIVWLIQIFIWTGTIFSRCGLVNICM